MKLRLPPWARPPLLALGVCLVLLACKEQTTSEASLGSGVIGSREATPGGPPASLQDPGDSPCRIAHIEWRDRSTPSLPLGTITAGLLEEMLPGHTGSGEPGWTLFVELAVTPSEADLGQLHFGVRGFLKDLNQVPPPVLEALATGEIGATADCNNGWNGAGCGDSLRTTGLEAPLRQVMEELSFLCRARRMDGDALVTALRGADAWQQAQLARRAGELGDTTTAPALRRLLDSNDDVVKLSAIAALGRLHDVAAIPQLVRMTQGAAESIVRAVMVSLADIGSAEARRYLETWAQHHPLNNMRELAAELLQGE